MMGRCLFMRKGEVHTAPSHIDANTLLLLHCNDLNDSSPYGVSITNHGATVSDAQSKFGRKSLYINGSQYLTIPAINFGAGDFTIDWWEYVTDANCGTRFTTLFPASHASQAGGLMVGWLSNGKPSIFLSTQTTGSANWDVLAGENTFVQNAYSTWVHRAVVRSGNNLLLFTNGTLEITVSIGSVSVGYNASLPFAIGKWAYDYSASGSYFVGYIDEFRISNIARWTENFTPPTKPY